MRCDMELMDLRMGDLERAGVKGLTALVCRGRSYAGGRTEGGDRIVTVELIPAEQRPAVAELKLSLSAWSGPEGVLYHRGFIPTA